MKTKILVLFVLVVVAHLSRALQAGRNGDKYIQEQIFDGKTLYDHISSGAGFIFKGKAQGTPPGAPPGTPPGPPPDGAPPGPPPDGAPPGPPPDGAPPGPPPDGAPPGPPPTTSS